MKKTYTNVLNYGKNILVRGFHENGERFSYKKEFYPTLFTRSAAKNVTSEWKDLKGNTVYPIEPGNIPECREFIKKYKDVQGFEVLGMSNWVTQFMGEEFPDTVTLDMKNTLVYYLDIETKVEHGRFPEPKDTPEEVSLITIFDSITEKYTVYSSVDVTPRYDILLEYGIKKEDIILNPSNDEATLLKNFVIDWQNRYPDIVTFWNGKLFDIPYLVNRITKVLGESFANKLSPWGVIKPNNVKINDEEKVAFDIYGISQLDMLDLMRKYIQGGRESWKLDNIAFEELSVRKVDFDGSFKEHQEDFSHFTAYNIIDSYLVKKLNDKFKFIELALTVAYHAKVTPEDIMGQIRVWDSIIYHDLLSKKIVVTEQTHSSRTDLMGGYVKDSIAGKHRWVVTLDLQSLYPHLMMWGNLSPDTISSTRYDVTIDELLDRTRKFDDLIPNHLAMAANGTCYDKSYQGFIPKLVEEIYNLRSKEKKEMLRLLKEYEATKDETLRDRASILSAKEQALKILINSCYGAVGSPYFRYYDHRIAEAITSSGQLAIRWVANDINKIINRACGTEGKDYVIASDTDSVMVSLESLVSTKYSGRSVNETIDFMDKFSAEVLQSVINKSFNNLKDYMNSYDQKLIMKREKLIDVGIWCAKKRYAVSVYDNEGVRYAEPKIKVTGLEIVRSSTPAVIRESLKNGVKEILYGTERQVQDYIDDYRKKFNELTPEQIAMPRGVNNLAEYSDKNTIYKKGCPIHVRAALLYNNTIKTKKLYDLEKIGEGAKMKFIYLKKPNPIQENIIGFVDKLPEQFKLNEYIDYDIMFDKCFISGMKTMMDPLGWTTEKQNSLFEFFN